MSLLIRTLVFCIAIYIVLAEEEPHEETTSQPVVTTVKTTTTTTTPPTTTPVPVDNYEFLVRLEYKFKEEQVPDFITKIISSEIKDTHISANDLIELCKVKHYNLEDTLELLNSTNISPDRIFNVNALEGILTDLKTPFANFYAALNQTLKMPSEKIFDALKDLDIDTNKFALAISWGTYNIFDVLRNGTFAEENIEKALEAGGLTKDQVFEAVRDVLFDDLRKLENHEFQELISALSLDQKSLLELWEIFGITTEDVYRVDTFKNMLDNIILRMNEENVMGVVTSQNTILIHSSNFDDWGEIQAYVSIKAKSLLKDGISVDLSGTPNRISRNVVEIPSTSKYGAATIEIAPVGKKGALENCTYVTYIRNYLRYQIVNALVEDGNLVVKKTNSTVFYAGGPLICNKKLYGIASLEDGLDIHFDALDRNYRPNPGHVMGSSNIVPTNAVLVIILLHLCIYVVN